MPQATRLGSGEEVPYFLWDEPMPLHELRRRMRESDAAEWTRLAGKVLREARFEEAIALVPIGKIRERYPELRRHLGRRRPFWDYLMEEWRRLGLLP